MPLFLPSSPRAACALAVSFFTVASTLSLANLTDIFHESRFPQCFPSPTSPRLQPLSEHDCLRALGIFLTNLPFGVTPVLTHDPDKAHLPQYVLAPAIAVSGECMFGADIPQGRDARINRQNLVYQAHLLIAACVGKAEYDGGRSHLKLRQSTSWIDIDFRYWVPLTNVTKNGVGNVTHDSRLVLNSATAVALPAISAIPDNAMVARKWAG